MTSSPDGRHPPLATALQRHADGLPRLERQRRRPSRVRVERERLVASVGDRRGRHGSAPHLERTGRRRTRPGRRPTDASSGGGTTPATSRADGWRRRSRAGSRSPCCRTSLEAGPRGSRSRATSWRSGSSPRTTTWRSSRSRDRLPGPFERARPRWGWGGRIRPGRAASPPMAGSLPPSHGNRRHPAPRAPGAGRGRRNGGGDARRCRLQPGPHRVEPSAGDERLLFTSRARSVRTPSHLGPRGPACGATCDVDLPGAAIPVGWWPDGSAILVRHEFEGRSSCIEWTRTAARRRSSPTRRRDRRCGGPARRSGLVPDERQRASPRAS